MELPSHMLPKHDIDDLNSLSFSDLETIKLHIEIVRRRILSVQNSQSPLLRLPGELRNRIFIFAMHMELQKRRKESRHAVLYTQPAFFAISRQTYAECRGLWLSDVLVWEEYVSESKAWRILTAEEIWAMCKERSKAGKLKLVTQPAHCDLGRTRGSVEGSRSICPRKGLARVVQGEGSGLPQMRWWVW